MSSKNRRIGSRKILLLEYELNEDDFKPTKIPQQEGGYGTIDFLKDCKKNIYAKKTSPRQFKKRDRLYVYREVNILIKIKHPTIIPFKGYSLSEDHKISIFTDYMKNGSLMDKDEIRNFDDTTKQIILVGIARGMMLLHKNDIIHRDLKPQNVLLDDKNWPRITDFGLSKYYKPPHKMHQKNYEEDEKDDDDDDEELPEQSVPMVGSLFYMAPEVMCNIRYDKKVDVYSFGILMYELVTGQRAYPKNKRKSMSPFNIFKELENKSLKLDMTRVKKKSLIRMIEACISYNPKDRPTFSELYNKLSLSEEKYFFEPGEGICEPIINSDDEDEDEEDKNSLKNKYCFDGINFDVLNSYINEIDGENDNSDIGENIEDLKAKNKQGDGKIHELEMICAELRENHDKLLIKNIELRNTLSKSKEMNQNLQEEFDKQREENLQMKEQIGQLKELIEKIASNQKNLLEKKVPLNDE